MDRDGKVTPYRIPRLKDVLEWGKDKVVFNFDNKYINTKGVSDEVRRASLDYYIRQLRPGGEWSMYHNIMLSVRSIEEALYYWVKSSRYPQRHVLRRNQFDGALPGVRRFAHSVGIHHGLYPSGGQSRTPSRINSTHLAASPRALTTMTLDHRDRPTR